MMKFEEWWKEWKRFAEENPPDEYPFYPSSPYHIAKAAWEAGWKEGWKELLDDIEPEPGICG
jgi:hypothetical protein